MNRLEAIKWKLDNDKEKSDTYETKQRAGDVGWKGIWTTELVAEAV